MPFLDLPLEQLSAYRSEEPEPPDFDNFWSATLRQSEAAAESPRFEKVEDSGLELIDVYDVTFSGFAGQPIRGWFMEPAGNRSKLPCIVKFAGYGGGRGLPMEHTDVVAAGFSLLVMDTRGQGSGWSLGHTPDHGPTPPQFPGFMTRGIDSPNEYYYRRVYIDAAMAVRAAALHEHVDAARIAVTGGSQGGALAIAAAALRPDAVSLLMADVPFLCHFRRATGMVDTMPYGEIVAYLKMHRQSVENVFRTLSYFDAVNHAARVKARTLFSVALMDNICPPSTVFAAYNAIQAEKEVRVYPYNVHEGGGVEQALERVRFARRHL